MEEKIIIKIGEIFLKGKNKYFFQNKLIENIKFKIKKIGNFLINNFGSVIVISSLESESESESEIEILIPHIKKIFGISAFSKAYYVEKDILKIKEVALFILQKYKKNITFKINTKRSDKKFYLNSISVSSEVGGFIVEKLKLLVDVNNPDLILNIEIRNDAVYMYIKIFEGIGGLPSGTSGKCISMLSCGIDSPVSTFMMAKRGLKIICVHFFTPPYTSEMSKFKVQKIVNKLNEYSNNIDLYIVNFTKIQENIKKSCDKELFTIISRRIMNKISEIIAIKEGCHGIITGESLGQVASQTLPSINSTNESVSIPILRPLIGMDKIEIINIAKKINTFDISIEPFDDCCSIFSVKHPCTNPNIKKIKLNEEKIENLNYLINECIESLEKN